jgi:hypothetical protein
LSQPSSWANVTGSGKTLCLLTICRCASWARGSSGPDGLASMPEVP